MPRKLRIQYPGAIYHGAGQIHDYDDNDNPAWAPGSATLVPGEAARIRLPPYAGIVTLTFVGAVKDGHLVNSLPSNASFRSSLVPQAGGITSQLGYLPTPGDIAFQYHGGYTAYFYDFDDNGNPAWTPSEPRVAVGEPLWFRLHAAENWTRDFSPCQ